MPIGGEPIEILVDDCIMCGLCVEVCPASPGVYEMGEFGAIVMHPDSCERCMLCTENCPTDAIKIRKGSLGDEDEI